MSQQRLFDYLDKNWPDNIDVDVVWRYLIILVRDEKLTFHQLKEIYLEYIIYKMFGSQGVGLYQTIMGIFMRVLVEMVHPVVKKHFSSTCKR